MKRTMLGLAMCLTVMAAPVMAMDPGAKVLADQAAKNAPKPVGNYKKLGWVVGGVAAVALTAYLLTQWLKAEETKSMPLDLDAE